MVKAIGHLSKQAQVSSTDQNLSGICSCLSLPIYFRFISVKMMLGTEEHRKGVQIKWGGGALQSCSEKH